MMERCPFCDESIALKKNSMTHIECPRCGEYLITEEALEDFSKCITPRARANVSGWIRENQRVTLTLSDLTGLLNLKTPSFHERADKLLMAFEKKTTYAGEFLKKEKSWISFGWCIVEKELAELLKYLVKSERIYLPNREDFSECKIAPSGWEHLEHLKKINIDSQQGFVAMWFDDDMMKIYNDIIAPGILAAGYKPHLVSQREHNGQIDDEIITQIRRSRFVLADFTGHRGGVYYEAGFAKGLGLEVFWTCRKDCKDDLHFDIRQYNCIFWEKDKLDEFKQKITYRIESVLGQGSFIL